MLCSKIDSDEQGTQIVFSYIIIISYVDELQDLVNLSAKELSLILSDSSGTDGNYIDVCLVLI